MSNRSNEALVALRRILKVTELNARALAQQSELTTSQILLLQYVAQQKQALPSAIARAIELKQATITVLLNQLEANGLVTRSRDTEDRRRVWVRLTDAGDKVLEHSPDLLQSRFQKGFDRLESWEQSMIITTLERIAALLDARDVEAAPILDVGDLDRLIDDE
jgi:DNA-binding MarR family transcriptional regulator